MAYSLQIELKKETLYMFFFCTMTLVIMLLMKFSVSLVWILCGVEVEWWAMLIFLYSMNDPLSLSLFFTWLVRFLSLFYIHYAYLLTLVVVEVVAVDHLLFR